MTVGPFKDIKLTLDTKLSALSGDRVIAWENIDFVPSVNVPYIRPFVLSAPTLGASVDGWSMFSGIYQIDIYYPVNKGVASILQCVDDIYNHFKSDPVLSSHGVEVYIRQISSPGLTNENGYCRGTVQINYECWIYN